MINRAVIIFEWLNEYIPPLSWFWAFLVVVPMILIALAWDGIKRSWAKGIRHA